MEKERKKRVAVYVRVSVKTEQTLHSAEAQADYYRELVEAHPGWEMTEIYADIGRSGTGVMRRPEFLRMLADCRAGEIDLIMVKSVSRFARNTLDLLNVVRKLKELNISVWFEEQKIDSLSQEGELMLTLAAAIAQAESESASENAKWAIRKRFAKGISNTRHRTFGYEWKEDEMVVVWQEAEIVRRIYTSYLDGSSQSQIARELRAEGVTSIRGNLLSVGAVGDILKNITYTGKTLLQKTYTLDPFTKKKIRNRGELPQYIVEHTHEAIISSDMYDAVQAKLEENRRLGKFPCNRTGQQYPFTGMIVCEKCGRHYTRQLWNTAKGRPKRATWVCSGKKMEKYRQCDAQNVSEERLMELSAQILGTKGFQEQKFAAKVEEIVVTQKNTVCFILRDGTKTEKTLKNRTKDRKQKKI